VGFAPAGVSAAADAVNVAAAATAAAAKKRIERRNAGMDGFLGWTRGRVLRSIVGAGRGVERGALQWTIGVLGERTSLCARSRRRQRRFTKRLIPASRP
jgi:hypothetical protein